MQIGYGRMTQSAYLQPFGRNKEVDAMRELQTTEFEFVSGAGEECSSGSGNEYGGVSDTESFGDELVNLYEGVVQAVSHVLERVANAISDW